MANEKRLIDANRALEIVRDQGHAHPNAYHLTNYATLILREAPTVDAVEFDHAVLVSVQIALESIRQYRRNVGHDPVFDFSQKELNELADYARYLLGGNMDGDGNV